MCFFKFGLSVNILTHTEHLCLLIFFREVILSMVVDILSDASLKNALLPSKMAKKCYQNIRKIIRQVVSKSPNATSYYKTQENRILKEIKSGTIQFNVTQPSS